MYSLQVEDIHKRYGSYKVLRDVSPRAGKGDVTSIIDSSGSGKSTFLRYVNFLEEPCVGRIHVGDEELRTHPGILGELRTADPRQLQRIRSRLAMVSQHFNLRGHPTMLENMVECPINVPRMNRDDAATRVRHYLTKVGLTEKVERQYPYELSSGQQQRVAIVCALTMEPQVMLFDGPTSALDPELVDEVPKVMRQLAEESHTMVLVTHEVAFARQVSSHVIFLHQGVVEERGTPDQVFSASHSERLRQFLTGNLR